MTIITEAQFKKKVAEMLAWMLELEGGVWRPYFVTGPGRSGAIASVYASHFLKVPFVPFGVMLPGDKRGVMIVDTAMNSGRTMRRALKKYDRYLPTMMWFYNEKEQGRVKFWYENWEGER